MNIRLKQLRHFIVTAQEGNIRRAAEKIHLTSPALSISLKNLEDAVGVPLLIKDRNGVSTTYAGTKFLDGAIDLLRQAEDLRLSVKDVQDSPAGTVRLGLPFEANIALAANLFKSILNDFPGINLVIEEGSTSSLERSFENGLFDLMIVYDVTEQIDRHSERLYQEHMYFISPFDTDIGIDGEIDAQDLGKLPVARSPGTHSMRTTIEKYAIDNRIKFDYLIDFQSAHASLRIVQEGLAHTIAPWCLVFDHVKNNSLSPRKIVNPPMERTAYLVTPSHNRQSVAAEAITQVLKMAIKNAFHTDKIRGDYLIE